MLANVPPDYGTRIDFPPINVVYRLLDCITSEQVVSGQSESVVFIAYTKDEKEFEERIEGKKKKRNRGGGKRGLEIGVDIGG